MTREEEIAALARMQRRDDCGAVADPQRLGDMRTIPHPRLVGNMGGLVGLAVYDVRDAGPDERNDDAEFLAVFVANALDDFEREVFHLMFGERKSVREAAQQLGANRSRVFRTQQKIVKKARAALAYSG